MSLLLSVVILLLGSIIDRHWRKRNADSERLISLLCGAFVGAAVTTFVRLLFKLQESVIARLRNKLINESRNRILDKTRTGELLSPKSDVAMMGQAFYGGMTLFGFAKLYAVLWCTFINHAHLSIAFSGNDWSGSSCFSARVTENM